MQSSPVAGQIFDNRFELLEQLGAGAIGIVFKARQLESNRIVALKILHAEISSDEEMHQRFMREARSMSQLSQKNIVSVYLLGQADDGRLYIAMEFIQGITLQAFLNENRMEFNAVLDLMICLSSALAYVHGAGIVHRDIKPANIVLANTPEPNTPKIIDFGLIRLDKLADQQKLTRTGTIIGTPHYMSPEQCKGNPVDSRSDIYSLCVCFYEMLAGERPFDTDNAMGMMYQHINEPVPRLSDGDTRGFRSEIESILKKGLAKKTDDRYASMSQLHDELVDLQKLSVLKKDAPRKFGTVAGGKRRFALLAIFSVSLVLLTLALKRIEPFISHNPRLATNISGSDQIPRLHDAPAGKTVNDVLEEIDKTGDLTKAAYLFSLAHKLSTEKKILSRPVRLQTILRYALYAKSLHFPAKSILLAEQGIAEARQYGITEATGSLYSSDELIALRNLYAECLFETGMKDKAMQVLRDIFNPSRTDVDQQKISSSNKRGILRNLLSFGTGRMLNQFVMNSVNSADDAGIFASLCLKNNKLLAAQAFIDGAEKAPDGTGLSVALELAKALLAWDRGQTIEQTEHLNAGRINLEKQSSLNWFRWGEAEEHLLLALALRGRSQEVFELLKIQSNLSSELKIPSKKLPASELASLMKKDPASCVFYAEYLVSSNRYSNREIVSLLLRTWTYGLPRSVWNSLMTLAQKYANDTVDAGDRRWSLHHSASVMGEVGLTRLSANTYERVLAELERDARNAGRDPKLEGTNVRVQLVLDYLDLGKGQEAIKHFQQISVKKAVEEKWTRETFAQECCLFRDWTALHSAIGECPDLEALQDILNVCLSAHQWRSCAQVLEKAKLIVASKDPEMRTLQLARTELMEVSMILEKTNYSLDGIWRAKQSLAKILLVLNAIADAKGGVELLRQVAFSAALCGEFDEAARISALADVKQKALNH